MGIFYLIYMLSETGRPSQGLDGFSSGLSHEDANAGFFNAIPDQVNPARRPDKKPTPVDGAKRTPPDGLVKAQMDAALERAKKNDPAYNQPMERGPIDVERVDPTFFEKKDSQESPAASQRENVVDINAETERYVAESGARTSQLRELIGRIDSANIGKNLNVKQLVRLLEQDRTVLESIRGRMDISSEVRGKVDQRIEVVTSILDTVSNMDTFFGSQSKEQQKQAGPQVQRPASQGVRPESIPAPKKTLLDRLKFWKNV